LRPSADRVRETLFNWLGQDLVGQRCLDLFAGSGALGFEALSRSAASVVMVEKSRRACEALRPQRRVARGEKPAIALRDALEFATAAAADAAARFDIVFLDRRFARRCWNRRCRWLRRCCGRGHGFTSRVPPLSHPRVAGACSGTAAPDRCTTLW